MMTSQPPLNPDAIHLERIAWARSKAALELAELVPEETEYPEISQMVEAVLGAWLDVFPLQPAVDQPVVNSVEELDAGIKRTKGACFDHQTSKEEK